MRHSYEWGELIDALREEVRLLRIVLRDGTDLGLAPDECREALARVKPAEPEDAPDATP